MSDPVDIEALATQVIDCGFHLHKDLGPGLLESAYEQLMAAELARRGIAVSRQVAMPLTYKGVVVDNAFKIDLLVERTLIVDLKSIERLAPVHGKQVLTYLRLMGLPLGLLMNFGQATFKEGLRRMANDYWRPLR
ncbi:GxxExxY protein [Qipengyuania sp. DY56-A-20]|jgi:iron complex transport system substrate-binding protein|uniref:GxxExxY protein n=1 Tax=Qipengyuania benthica TaxID=3067651 RepID=A0ABT9H895_9SPHN|nr:GxxExxY protein [Qipengyuania sp. DY56-A-20]MDP4539550.1 GxxExxY protein [Qipengyuania sp. DY56-A-20]